MDDAKGPCANEFHFLSHTCVRLFQVESLLKILDQGLEHLATKDAIVLLLEMDNGCLTSGSSEGV